MSDADWSPGAGGNSSATVSMDDSESDYVAPQQIKKTTRRTSSSKNKNKKKQLSDNEASSDNSPINPRRRTSIRNKNKSQGGFLNLASDSDNENKPIVANTKRKRNSSSKKQSMSIDTNPNDADNESDTPIKSKPDKKKKTRKRKSEDNQVSAPPKKKRRTSNTNTNTNTNNKKKKAKPGKLKGDDAVETVRDKMVQQNRPHSKNSIRMEIGENLITAKECEKALNELDKDGILVNREFGKKAKTKIYWPNQDDIENDNDDDDDEQESERKIKEREMTLRSVKERLKRLKNERIALARQETDEELNKKMNQLTTKNNSICKKWNDIEELVSKSGGAKRVSKDDLDDKLLLFYKYGRVWKERKDSAMEMISQCFMDAKEKPNKILTSKMNGETDKDNDVEWDTYKEMYKLSSRTMQQKKDQQRHNKRK